MQWYPLFENLRKILGVRLANLFAYTISEASGSVLCSTFFRKTIIEAGEEPEHPELSQKERLILDFGVAISMEKGRVPDELYRQVSALYNDEQMVVLVAFAGQMIATSVFNNAVETDIDEHLIPYLPFVVFF
jgi:alkylhydroperoxidase family enzyme